MIYALEANLPFRKETMMSQIHIAWKKELCVRDLYVKNLIFIYIIYIRIQADVFLDEEISRFLYILQKLILISQRSTLLWLTPEGIPQDSKTPRTPQSES